MIEDMTEGSPSKIILKFAMPMLLSWKVHRRRCPGFCWGILSHNHAVHCDSDWGERRMLHRDLSVVRRQKARKDEVGHIHGDNLIGVFKHNIDADRSHNM